MKPALPKHASLVLVCCALLVLTWARAAGPAVPAARSPVSFHALEGHAGFSPAPGLTVEGVWRIEGSGEQFGGYSGLIADEAGRLVAVGDGGGRLDFTDPGQGDPHARLSWLLDGPEVTKARRDAEALTRDPATGRIWVGYEFRNAIARFDPVSGAVARIRPPAMKRWSPNSGPEAMARLPDGRFVALAEMQFTSPLSGGPGLLFPSDPVKGEKPVMFRFDPPRGFFASDMASLPDGRVLILARRLTFPFPPMFASQLLLADPAAIRPGEAWDWHLLARIESPVPRDNYEGIAVAPRADGALTIWLISDDNAMATQQTLLLKLQWNWKPLRQRNGQTASPNS